MSKVDLGDYKLPTLIQEAEAKHHYVCVGIKAKDTANGMGKVFEGRTVYATHSKWQDMNQEINSGRVKTLFHGVFQQVIVLNNPTLPMVEDDVPKADKPKGLSPTHKGKANDLLEDGKEYTEEELKGMAKEVGVSLERLKYYIESK